MKSQLLSILFALLCVSAKAQDGVYFGYCNGDIADGSHGVVTGKTGAGTIHVALCLQAEDMSKYVGCEITAVHVGLAQKTSPYSIDVTAWVRENYKDSNISDGKMTSVAGWNKIALENPVKIEAGKNYYIGYSFEQSQTEKIISLVGEDHQEGALIAKGDTWSDYSQRGYGVVSIEAWIEGQSLPGTDISAISLKPEKKKIKRGDTVAVNGIAKNMGSKAIDYFVVEYKTNGTVIGAIEVIPQSPMEFRSEQPYSFTVGADGVEGELMEVTATIKLGKIGATMDDDRMEDNTISTLVGVFDKGYQHRVLLEEFTGEGCGYCPSGAKRIKAAIENNELHGLVSWVCLHAVFEDFLTTSETREYTYMYDPDLGGYCPAMIVDRRIMSNFPAFYNNGKLINGPVHNVNGISDIAEELLYVLEELSLVNVTVDEAQVIDGMVEITVSCEKSTAFDAICSEPLLTVIMKEDDVEAHKQSDYTGDFTGKHENVFRKTLTSVWGDPITWDNERATYKFQYEIPSDVNAENLSVVAFIHQYDDADRTKLEVYNTGEAKVKSEASIISVENDNTHSQPEYNLFGQRIKAEYKGIVISKGMKSIKL